MNNKHVDSLKQQVYDALFSDIIKGVYSADFIFTEKYLMEKYQVSRAPIRESLMQFMGNNILVSIPRHGYRIIQPSEGRLFEITKFRSALECSFLENYSCYIKAADIKILRDICINYEALPSREFLARWSYNCDFHLKLFTLYGNEYARTILENTLNMQTIFYALKMKSHAFSIDLHLAMLDYLEKGELTTASNLLRADIESLLCVTPWLSSSDS